VPPVSAGELGHCRTQNGCRSGHKGHENGGAASARYVLLCYGENGIDSSFGVRGRDASASDHQFDEVVTRCSMNFKDADSAARGRSQMHRARSGWLCIYEFPRKGSRSKPNDASFKLSLSA